MGGSTTAICLRNNDKELKTSNTAPDSPYHGTLSHVGSDRKKQRTAFHLPEVCREIYSETATLGYAPERILLRWQGSWTRGHAGRRHGGMVQGEDSSSVQRCRRNLTSLDQPCAVLGQA